MVREILLIGVHEGHANKILKKWSK